MHFLQALFLVISLLGLFAGAGIGGSATIPPEAAPFAAHTIMFPVNGLLYSPADITIFAGEDVEWSGPFAFHPLVSEDNLWPVVSTGNSFVFTYDQPGVYRYYCQLHGAPEGVGMSGVVRVVAPMRTYLPTVWK